MDSRVDALTLVTSGGRRNGAHSYSSDISESQPVGNQVRTRRGSAAHRVPAACSMTWTPAPDPDTTYKVSDVSSKANELGCCTVG